DKNLALLNLSLLTGQIGKPGAGPFSLTGQPNAMGGREVGGMATMLAAHRDLADPAQREHVARFWGGGKIAEAPGLTATEMIEALESGRLKALWIICTNPAVSWPNLGRAERALQNAAFVVVQDISTHADTLAFADLVLPAAGWLEKEGTMTNSERRVSHLPKAIEPPGEALADWQILCRFAWAMGWGEAFSYANASEIFDEHCRLTRGTRIDMSGMNYRRLKREGALQWPCPGEQHPGMARLFTGHDFATPDGRARLTAVRPRPHAAPVNDAFPFVLLTGRTRDQWHTMTRTGKVSRLLQHEAAPYLEVHPRDAERLELGEGDVAIVENERGQVRAQVRITDSIKEGAVFLPMHWGKAFNGALARANNLTSGLVDPISKEPDFKYAAVRVGPVQSRKQQILVVGAGAAAHQFIRSYRESGGVGRLVVFGREALPFYNRILLPEYIAGAKAWRELVTLDASQLGSLGVEYVAGAEVVKIERDFKRVVLANGSRQPYDKLVLAVGSSASVPKEVPRNLPGIFVLRERGDADRIRASLQRNEPVVIVGGGPLGVELADALAHSGAQVTLIHRSTSLMGGVLDATAARLVKEILEERGVEVYLKDAILRYEGGDAVEAVHTRSGLRLPCRAVCIAAGTAPNNALPRQAGLDVAQGVLVNRHMQTSDPDIYAIGEIAEFNGTRHGTTAAAQEQATAAANHLKGHTWNNYRGSVPFNVLKIRDADVCSIGLVNPAGNDCDEITLLDARMRYYKKCVVRGARLVGAILVGDKTEFGEFRRLIEEQTELEDLRATLLRKTSATRRSTPRGKLVCSCFNVGEGDLKEAIDAGCDELESVCARSLAGTGCGSCRPDVQALLDRHCALQCLAMAK
ncbi:MAG: FAD-dependent oxidoreductase, partial [Candidatus Hydrogenedentes bacterium]|nr:FAD-dependent oxidoreductase [Candidatus Hydrogenedentota bacterium]